MGEVELFGMLLIGTPLLSVSAATMSPAEWFQIALNTNPQSLGCAQMSYPSTTWTSVTCSSHRTVPANVGNGADKVATGSTAIGLAYGVFTNESGITSEYDPAWNNDYDYYSAQMNTQFFYTTTSYTTGTPEVWQQFVWQNDGSGSNYGWLSQELWLPNYYTNNGACPATYPTGLSAWTPWPSTNPVSCYTTGTYGSTNTETILPTALNDLLLEGITGQSGNDVAKMCNYATDDCYTYSVPDIFGLSSNWKDYEFNVFGFGGGSSSIATFNSGSSLTVETHVYDASSNPITPSCSSGGTTAEQNNFNLGTCSAGSGYMDFYESN